MKCETLVAIATKLTSLPKGGGYIKEIREAGVIPQSPFEVRDGWVDWTIECSAQKSRELVHLLRKKELHTEWFRRSNWF